MKRFVYIVLLTILLAACTETATAVTEAATPRPTSTPRPEHPTPNAAELEISDPIQPIEVTVGSTFTITVRTAPSPELHWELSEALDPKVVGYVWKHHIPDNAATTNSSGKDVWRFQAVGPGTANIKLGYYSGMEMTSQLEYVFKVIVTE